MEFKELLNQYITRLDCSAKELAEASGLSATVISRYRTGERQPSPESEQLLNLALGLARLASQKGISDLSEEKVLSELQNSLNRPKEDYSKFVANFDHMINILDVNMKTLSTAMNFDLSYLYRIRSGQRRPNDLNAFCNSFCRFLAAHHNSPSDKKKAAILLGCPASELTEYGSYILRLREWIYSGTFEETSDYMENFLKKLDEFNLDEYIRAIHFNDLKVPSVPFRIHSSKTYYGVEEMRKGELDFFKATVLSKSQEPIFMCSDMPMEDMAQDMDFNKKWMFAIAMSLKKGLHLNIIHNIDRPFQEMMLGLESWIPIYMTGQVSPYHLPGVSTSVYHHFNYVSGAAALTGECINGYHKHGKYYLTTNKEEVTYYRQKAADLLSKAQPLMEIYRSSSEKLFHAFLLSSAEESGSRRNILSSPPLYTISPALLGTILSHSRIAEAEKERILSFAGQQRERIEQILQNNTIQDETIVLSREEFEKHPVTLALADTFVEADIPYTYEEYLSHIRMTKDFAASHPHYRIQDNAPLTFRNIQIHILESSYVMISKLKTPVIHFVIRHSKMVSAIKNFIPPMTE